jgi:hypothetical protein
MGAELDHGQYRSRGHWNISFPGDSRFGALSETSHPPLKLPMNWLTKIAAVMIVVALGGLGFAVLYSFDPSRTAWYPPCLLHQYTGWHCPGCGSTRMLHAMSHGDLSAAIGFNPLLVAAIGLSPLLIWRRHLRRAPKLSAWLTRSAIVVVIAFGVLRNIPYHPFTLLAPRAPRVESRHVAGEPADSPETLP